MQAQWEQEHVQTNSQLEALGRRVKQVITLHCLLGDISAGILQEPCDRLSGGLGAEHAQQLAFQFRAKKEQHERVFRTFT